MMSDKVWKAQERRVAKALGTERTSLSGRQSKAGTSSDSLHKRFYIEAKYRQKIAVIEWFREIVPKARKEGKTPILTLKAANRKEDYAVVKLAFLVELLSKAGLV